jgi:hypothetical protein
MWLWAVIRAPVLLIPAESRACDLTSLTTRKADSSHRRMQIAFTAATHDTLQGASVDAAKAAAAA